MNNFFGRTTKPRHKRGGWGRLLRLPRLLLTGVAVVAVMAATVVPSLSATKASAVTNVTTRVTWVPTAINTSGFGANGGTITVTYTPAFDATHLQPAGTNPQPFTVSWQISDVIPTNAYVGNPNLTWSNWSTPVDHTANGANALRFQVDMTGGVGVAPMQKNTPFTADPSWTNSGAVPASKFNTTVSGSGSPLTVPAYTPVTATSGQFVVSQRFTATGGAAPTQQSGFTPFPAPRWESIQTGNSGAGNPVSHFGETVSVDGAPAISTTGLYNGLNTSTVDAAFVNDGTSAASTGFDTVTRALIFREITASVSAPLTSSTFSCAPDTVYAVNAGGDVYKITPSTGASTPNGAIVDPSGVSQNVNALALPLGGGNTIWALNRNVSSGQIMKYNVATGTTQTFNAGATVYSDVIAGAINPANGIYYFASGATTWTFYAFDTNTNTFIGEVGTLTASGLGINGDMAFDTNGQLYIISNDNGANGTGTAGSLFVLNSAPPTTAGTPALSGTTITSSLPAGSGQYNSAAFAANGALLIGTSLNAISGDGTVLQVDPQTGAIITQQATAFQPIDYASCNYPATIQLQKNLPDGRLQTGDQFTLTIGGPSVPATAPGNPVTTTGNASGIQPTVAGPVLGIAGRTYTIAEAGAAGTNLAAYASSAWQCVNTANGNAVVATGTGTTGSFTMPAASSTPSAILCTFTNTPPPKITLSKALAVPRLVNTDQFTVAIRTGGANGTVVNNQANSTTQGSGSTVNAGTGTTGVFVATAATAYTLTEAGAGTANLANYTATITCTDSNGLQTGLPNGAAYNPASPPTITPVAGANISCVITNSAQPQIQLTKVLATPREADTDQFTVALRTGGATGNVVSSQANWQTTGAGSTVTAGSGTTGVFVATAGTAYTLTEAAAGTANLANYTATITCTDSNGLQTGLPNGAAYNPASPPTITPVAGANISCVITNSAQPIMSWNKVVDKGAGTAVNPGDTLTYTVSITNSGSVANPTFTAFDDLTNVVNQATFNTGSITITPAGTGTATYDPTTKHLTFTGPIAAHSTVTISYSVTVNANAFGQLKNAFIDKSVTNPINGTLQWKKVDSKGSLLGGSQWTLTPQPSGTAITITDCTASPCTGADKDPVAGQFSVPNLVPGNYQLTETKAPAGFVLLANPISVTVSNTQQVTVLANVTNVQQTVPTIPLTGGIGRDELLLAGGGILLLTIVLAVWQRRRRRTA